MICLLAAKLHIIIIKGEDWGEKLTVFSFLSRRREGHRAVVTIAVNKGLFCSAGTCPTKIGGFGHQNRRIWSPNPPILVSNSWHFKK
jgi:hypothetical protein